MYAFVIEGGFKVAGETLKKRDALGIWETDKITLESEPKSSILLVDVPMNF